MQDYFSAQLIARLSTEIERHKEHVKRTPDRQARLSALKDAVGLIDELSKLTRTKALATAPAFCEGSLSRLGELMSSHSIEEIAGYVAWMVDERAINDALDRRGRGDIHFMDRLTRDARRSVSVQIGPMLLRQLLDGLKAPLEGAIRLELGNTGGRPALVYRNYVVEELARDYWTRIGAWPSPAKSGPFIEACQNVLIQLKINIEGLEAALERTIKKLKT